MIYNNRITAVLDTNVIYPVISRDLLFWFAYYELYTPKWTDNIFDEWKDVMIRKGVAEPEAIKRTKRANLAFPDALVRNYYNLIPDLELPDEKDRHVLAAAVKTDADVIVTNNLKDFPPDYLRPLGLIAKTADDFLTDIINLHPGQTLLAFEELVSNKKNPVLNKQDVLNQLQKIGLSSTASRLQLL